jgi:hypothetical protein
MLAKLCILAVGGVFLCGAAPSVPVPVYETLRLMPAGDLCGQVGGSVSCFTSSSTCPLFCICYVPWVEDPAEPRDVNNDPLKAFWCMQQVNCKLVWPLACSQ